MAIRWSVTGRKRRPLAITLNRPEKPNALNPKVFQLLDANVQRSSDSAEAKVATALPTNPTASYLSPAAVGGPAAVSRVPRCTDTCQ